MRLSTGASAILLYHSLDQTGGLFSIDPALFRRHVEAIVQGGIAVAPLARIRETPGALALTFDDGHRNFLDHALPLLVEFHIPATMFVVSGYCGHKPGALTWREVKEIAAAGIHIGAHSVTHRHLTTLSAAEAQVEMRDSQAHIEDRLGMPVRAFAYPYGRSNTHVRRQASEIFDLACGVKPAQARGGADPFDLPRIFDFYVRNPARLRRLASVEGFAYLALRRAASALRRRVTAQDRRLNVMRY
jgi:peptidoglycan/xylan/chitin deacetylase (PgdA/CDA1 family)